MPPTFTYSVRSVKCMTQGLGRYYNTTFYKDLGMIVAMALTLILGPMKSGKSLELIARIAPHEFAGKRIRYIQPIHNTRDEGVVSRSGIKAQATKVNSLTEVENHVEAIGVDEINMFAESDVDVVRRWISEGKEVVISGLDLDYRGKLIPVVARILELKPDTIIVKTAVCEVCHGYDAKFTQILHNKVPVLEGLPVITPEDGSYDYQARCRACFKQA